MKSDKESIELNEMSSRAPLVQLLPLEPGFLDLSALNFNINDIFRNAHNLMKYRMNEIPRNENKTFSLLPQPLLIVIFQYLTVADLVRSSSVCREWNSLLKLNDVWLNRLQRDFPDSPPEPEVPSKTAYAFKYRAKTHERLKKDLLGENPRDSVRSQIQNQLDRNLPNDYRFFNRDVVVVRDQTPRVDDQGVVHYGPF